RGYSAMFRSVAVAVLAATLASLTFAQSPSPCDPPFPRALSVEENFFTEAQERDLGDAIAEHLQRTFNVIDDGVVDAYLKQLGARIVAQLPPSSHRFTFSLVDLPDANAFVLPGGRVY